MPRGRQYQTPKEIFDRNVVVSHNDDCHIWIGSTDSAGYGVTTKKGAQVKAHRWSFEINNGPIPNGMYVLHKCDNRRCVNPSHLFIGTHDDNMRDKALKGRAAQKLNEHQVRAIREDHRIAREIASEYGVHPGTISEIKRRKIWAHIA